MEIEQDEDLEDNNQNRNYMKNINHTMQVVLDKVNKASKK